MLKDNEVNFGRPSLECHSLPKNCGVKKMKENMHIYFLRKMMLEFFNNLMENS